MPGSIELDPDNENLQIRFDYREDLVQRVKTLPGRRWDRNQKVWRVPKQNAAITIELFMSDGFVIAPEVTALLAGTMGEAAAIETTPPATDPEQLTVGGLNALIQRTLRDGFPQPVWVVGEILDYDKGKDREHVFFALVEKARFGDQVHAQAAVALFGSTRELVQARLRQAGDRLDLGDGVQVRVLVRVDYYLRQGRCQLVIEDIDPTFTLGQMALSREKILAELRRRGLFDRNRLLPLPVPALRIGVLASPDSDGWKDFEKELAGSDIGFCVTCYPIKTQGQLLQPTLLAGLSWFADRHADFDVLCILRGGGSRSDLSWFDNQRVAIAVATHPLKVLCGIGHERDRSVLDEITHSEKTPTAVAGRLVRLATEERQRLVDRSQQLRVLAHDVLTRQRRRLDQFGHDLRRLLENRVAGERQRLVLAGRRLVGASARLLAEQERILRDGRRRLRTASLRQLTTARGWIDTRADKLRLLDPVRVLERGFTLARDAHGRIVTSMHKVASGSTLQIQFRDGRAEAVVQSTKANEPNA